MKELDRLRERLKNNRLSFTWLIGRLSESPNCDSMIKNK